MISIDFFSLQEIQLLFQQQISLPRTNIMHCSPECWIYKSNKLFRIS